MNSDDILDRETMQIDDDITDLARAFTLFSTCYENLYAHLLRPENDNQLAIELFQDMREPHVREQYLLELNHLVYAAVTSMTALVAVSDILRKRYKSTTFYLDYMATTSKIMNTPSFNFWRRLRNYVTHNSEAPWIRRISPGKNQTKCKIYLDSSILLKYDWRLGMANDSPKDEKTVEYLTRYKDGIYLGNIIFAYKKEMGTLWKNIFIGMNDLKQEQILKTGPRNDSEQF